MSEGRIKAGENVSIISDPIGIVLGMPPISENALVPGISAVWNEGILSLTSMDSVSGISLALLSAKTSYGFFLGSLVNESRFVFPQLMKLILLGAFFLTVYLTVFLLFNLRQDSFTIVQNRLKQLQISLIEQYYDRKNDIDWGHWSRELEQRREEIRSELKQGIKTKSKTGKDEKNDIDVLIDKSWDELLNVIGGRRDKAPALDEEKLQTILNRILSAGAAIPAPAAGAAPVRAEAPAAAEEVEELGGAEAVEELADAEPAEAAEELEELGGDAEAVEELSEAEPAETAEELEELGGDAEAVEELSEAEPAEAAEELEELGGNAEAVEELADAEPVAAEEPARAVAEIPELAEMGELTGADIDQVMAPQGEGEPEELEELDELDEAETGETDEPEELVEPAGDSPKEMSGLDLANLASQIEFSSSPLEEESEPALEKELEIVSPFATMLSEFSDDGSAEDTQTEPFDDIAEEKKKSPKRN
jgi:hypothetical protein